MLDNSLDLSILLAILVTVVGMPHGALDHLFARRLCWPRFGRWWPVLFLSAYLAVAAAVVAGWIFVPAVTVSLFFLLSAFHFGDDAEAVQPAAVLDGGLVIWVPLLTRPNEVCELLACVIPAGDPQAVHYAVRLVEPVLWAIAMGFVITLHLSAGRTAARKVLFLGMFATLPVLASFILYFCGWHSIRELAALARQADSERPWRGLWKVMGAAAPTAGLAVVGTAVGAWWFAGSRELSPVVVQAVFLGLSAVAVPHILLQALVKCSNLNPFSPDEEKPT